MPLAVCVCDSQWNVLEVNSEAKRLFSFGEVGQRESLAIWSVFSLPSHEFVGALLRERASLAQAREEETWRLNLDFAIQGSQAPTELTVSALPTGIGESQNAAWQVCLRTGKGEERASPWLYAASPFEFHGQITQNITEQAVDPIFVIGGKGEILFANPEAERIFGWPRDELTGKSLHETLHHERADGSSFPVEQCPLYRAQIDGKVIRGLELVFFHRNGRPVNVSCSNSPLYFDNQEIGAVLIVRDISQQKIMERALAESEERLRVAVAAAQMGAWDLNLLSGDVILDDNCRKALNLHPDGHNFVTMWLRAVHPDDRALAKRQIESALNPEGDGQLKLECRTVARAGASEGGSASVRSVQAQGQAFFEDLEGKRRAVRLIGTVQDITDRKRDEYALRRANDDLQQFAYAAAHDLQEPLRNVVNLLGLYKRNLGSQLTGENSALIDASMEDARRMHQMVRDLLSFSAIHQGLESTNTVADANSILQDVRRNLVTSIAEAGANIQSYKLPRVKMRPTHLLQLFQNVISNSLKYRRPAIPLEVRIRARRRGAEWVFSVADNGIGFDPAYAQKIFGVFKRLHGRSEYPGSGIGLAICARIVHTYSGKIWAEGVLGQGATFYFTLPAAVSEAQRAMGARFAR